MDLNEHALTESQRVLKRLGITHLLLPSRPDVDDAPSPEAPPQTPSHGAQPVPPPLAQNSAPADQPLPPLLRSLFHGKHAPVRTLWTYAGLYEDLQQAELPPRLSVFKKIQDSVCQHLKWAATDISAWPLDVDPRIFRQGIAHLRPRTVIYFRPGSASADGMNADIRSLLEQAGSRVVTLPCLEEMAEGNQQLKNEAWKILQTVPA